MESNDPYKKIGIALFVFLLILIPLEISLLKPQGSASNSKDKVAAAKNEYPRLYFVELEYDPSTKTATRIQSGDFAGDTEYLESTPLNSPDKFSFKIETISSSGELLLSGWASRSISIITTTNGKYRFKVFVPYVTGETLTIYSIEDKILWSGKII